jgi:hypothetical protein
MNVEEMIRMFHLEEEVEDFVKARVRELVQGQHHFSFSGSNLTGYCGVQEPHIPHVFGHYGTVVYGSLSKFCLGREGVTPEGYVHIVITEKRRGDAYTPSYAKGYWWIEEVEK